MNPRFSSSARSDSTRPADGEFRRRSKSGANRRRRIRRRRDRRESDEVPTQRLIVNNPFPLSQGAHLIGPSPRRCRCRSEGGSGVRLAGLFGGNRVVRSSSILARSSWTIREWVRVEAKSLVISRTIFKCTAIDSPGHMDSARKDPEEVKALSPKLIVPCSARI